MEDMIGKLNDRLRQQPEDPTGWAMLGRSYAHIGRHEDASRAFAEAVAQLQQRQEQVPASLLLSYAQALAVTSGESYEGKPAALIKEALRQEPDNPNGLWLAGMMNFQNGEYAQALRYWKPLRERVQAGSEDAKVIDSLIAQANANLPDSVIEEQGSEDISGPSPGGADKELITPSGIKVSVALGPALTKSAGAEDTVFVFARAVTGPPMPLAIVRKQVKDLPFTVTLNDSQAMMSDMKLSQFPEVLVGARISRSGIATAQSGDLQGAYQAVATDTGESVSVVIDQLVP